jgi:tetratricopeptide (TPR) repeat protein
MSKLSARMQEALLLYQGGQLSRARIAYEKILRAHPRHFLALYHVGMIAGQNKDWEAAADFLGKAIIVNPNSAAAHNHRGVALKALGQLDAALASYDQAIALNTGYAEAYSNRANLLRERRELGAALADYDKAIALKPDFGQARLNRSMTLLLRGEFELGWVEHEWRWRSESSFSFSEKRHFQQPLWLGDANLVDKTVLIYSEQGLGDTIQFCRYVKLVAERGARVILEVQKPLHRLLENLEGVAQLLPAGAVLPDFDFHCPLMSLPLAFKTTLASVPQPNAYLKSDPVLNEEWRRRLRPEESPLIGLAWSGSVINRHDRARSIVLEELIKYLPADFTYVVLQKDVREADAVTLRANPRVLYFDKELDFHNTAAICACLDLVISVDTSIAHLSGALGTRTWILLPFVPDWRWLLDRDDSPWYRTAKLYRQSESGNWMGVLERVQADLIEERSIVHRAVSR